MEENLIHATDDDFTKEVEQSTLPVVVDFWASWCMPCQMFGPVFAELAPEFAGKIKFVKVEVEECPATANRFGIKSIPTIYFFDKGEVAKKLMGAQDKDEFRQIVNTFLSENK